MDTAYAYALCRAAPSCTFSSRAFLYDDCVRQPFSSCGLHLIHYAPSSWHRFCGVYMASSFLVLILFWCGQNRIFYTIFFFFLFAICNEVIAKHAFLRHISYPRIWVYCRIFWWNDFFNRHETDNYIIMRNVK